MENALLENLALGCLGKPKVHHLVQQLIDNHKVVPDRLLFELLEVLGQDGREAVEEDDNFGCVRVTL